MFDDVSKEPTPSTPPATPPPPPPVGDLSSPSQIPPQNPQHPPKPSSGFSKLGSRAPSSLVPTTASAEEDMQMMSMLKRETLSPLQKVAVVGAIVVVIGSFIAGGIWLYLTLDPASNTTSTTRNDDPDNPDPSQDSKNSTSGGVPLHELDTDEDGLRDIDEKKFGTNIDKKDSDDDGLSDYDEIKTYTTNPTNPDTDGDGYVDGREEVDRGYDPKGTGRL